MFHELSDHQADIVHDIITYVARKSKNPSIHCKLFNEKYAVQWVNRKPFNQAELVTIRHAFDFARQTFLAEAQKDLPDLPHSVFEAWAIPCRRIFQVMLTWTRP